MRERAVTERELVACRFVVVFVVGHDTWKRSFQHTSRYPLHTDFESVGWGERESS